MRGWLWERGWKPAAAVLLFLVACGGPGAAPAPKPSTDTIVVASFNFPESEVLAEVYGQALVAKGIPVRMALDLGPRELVEPALLRGLVHLVPEYLGSALDFLSRAQLATANPEATHAALDRALAGTGVAALRSSGAQDTNALAVTGDTAARYRLHSISDLAAFAPSLVMGGPPECPQRPLCLRGLREVYGLRFRSFVPLDAGGPLTVRALAEGDVDAALMFTTDPAVAEHGFLLLRDDLRLEPAENVTPVMSRVFLRRYGPRVSGALNAVSDLLTTPQLLELNRAVAGGQPPADVARDWLVRNGLA